GGSDRSPFIGLASIRFFDASQRLSIPNVHGGGSLDGNDSANFRRSPLRLCRRMPAHTFHLLFLHLKSRLAFLNQTLNIRSNLSREHDPCHGRKTSHSVVVLRSSHTDCG